MAETTRVLVKAGPVGNGLTAKRVRGEETESLPNVPQNGEQTYFLEEEDKLILVCKNLQPEVEGG